MERGLKRNSQDGLITFQMHHYFSLTSWLLGCGCVTAMSYPKISQGTTSSGIGWRMCLEFPFIWLRWVRVSKRWRCTHWSSRVDSCMERAVFPPPGISTPIARVKRFPSLRQSCYEIEQGPPIPFLPYMLLLSGAGIGKDVSPTQCLLLIQRWLCFCYSLGGSETDYFSLPCYLFPTLRKRDLWNY